MPHPYSTGRDATQDKFTSILEFSPQLAAALTGELSAYARAGAFAVSVSLTAAAAATPVTIIPAANVGTSRKLIIIGWRVVVNGATDWTDSTGTLVSIQDTTASPVSVASIAKAALTGNSLTGPATSGVTNGNAYLLGTPLGGGGTGQGQGLVIVADHNFAAGSTIEVTVFALAVPVALP